MFAAYVRDAGTNGTFTGPFVGYKWTLPVGFTFLMRGGLGALVQHDETSTMPTTNVGLFPYAALDLGWSL